MTRPYEVDLWPPKRSSFVGLSAESPNGGARIKGAAKDGAQLAKAIEKRIVDPDTGAAKGQKRARFDLIPPQAIWDLAEQYGYGADKYEDRNWESGYAWSLAFGAMQRHAWQFWNGEDLDEDSGLPHLAAVAFHAFTLLTYRETHPEKDDRTKQGDSE